MTSRHTAGRSLRIAILSTAKGWHGGEAQMAELARGLRSRGHECLIVARRRESLSERMLEEEFQIVNFRGKGRNPSALWRIRKSLKRWQPDVVHYNDSHAVTVGGLATVGLGIRARLGSRRVVFPVRSAANYMRFCDQVVCVSNSVADVCRAGGIPDRMLAVVHDGVAAKHAQSGVREQGRRSLELKDDQIMLLTVASLTDPKGHQYLLAAMPRIISRYPNVVLMLAGDGELQRELCEQSRRLGLERHVRFLGYRRDAPDLIAACDAFVLPSTLEGLCTSLIDAMHAARPIVATTAGGIPDLLGTGDDEPVAWTVPPKDPHALAMAIQEAISSPDEADIRRRRACLRAGSKFTADCMVDNTLDVIHRVLHRAPSRFSRRAA